MCSAAPGPFQLQAAIAALHATAATAAETAWVEIAPLYQRLDEMVAAPVVALNRAVAVALAEGPEAGLALVDELEQDCALSESLLTRGRGQVSRDVRPTTTVTF